MALTRCLHITDPTIYVEDRHSLLYNKMHQTRWLVNSIRKSYKWQWNLSLYITIDETMVKYKGKYCEMRQYMLKKPIKWCVKVWCVADLKSKFIYDFDVYYGKSESTIVGMVCKKEEMNMARRVGQT